MANMIDYLVWRGELTLEASPWNEVDGLLLATLSYLNFHGIQHPKGWTLEELKRLDAVIPSTSSSYPLRKQAFEGMADSIRFGKSRVHHFIAMTDETKTMQFSAMCVDLPDGTMGVAFRGTDNTMIGWREDFNMAYQTRVPGQIAAEYYLTRAAQATDRPLRVTGHSKGGNLAVYAAASVAPEVQDRIVSLQVYDGPGMNREISSGEAVVKSIAGGISQHDPMTWQVYGKHFEELPGIDRTAGLICETLHEWLQNSTPEQRGAFVDAMFQMADGINATKMSDITNEKLRSMWKMFGSRKEIDPELRRVFSRLTAQAVTLGFGNVVERVRGKREEGVEERAWETMIPDEEDEAAEDEKKEENPS